MSMQQESRNLISVLEHAARFHGNVEIVSRAVEDGQIHRYAYADAYRRSKQLASALRRLGVVAGDRVATIAWNSFRHFETWYAVAGQGAICHTVNPRLFDDQLIYILNHAKDRVLLVDPDFVPLVDRLYSQLPHVQHVVVLSQTESSPESGAGSIEWHNYERLIQAEPESFAWPELDDETPSSLCYTSGTTGEPKGVLYTHRSNLLHAYAALGKSAIGIGCDDTLLLNVPMFHANSWGLAYACPMVGARLVMPGSRFDGESIHQLLEQERVTVSAGVPTIWHNLIEYVRDHRKPISYLQEVHIGGSALSRNLLEAFLCDHGIRVVQGWGLTEMSPLGSTCRLKSHMLSWPHERQVEVLLKQGLPLSGVSMKLVDDDDNELPHDGERAGRLLVKGPWVVRRYYGETEDAVDEAGWLDTGDIATIDPNGYMQITDRAKDLIKSGGEWISSVVLENAAAEHPGVAMSAAIGIAHPKWGERPVLIIKPAGNASVDPDEIKTFLKDRVARWWIPEEIVFVDEMPLTGSGKILKKTLRERYADRGLSR